MNRDLFVVVLFVLAFAIMCTLHVSIALACGRIAAWRGLVGLVAPPAGWTWAWRSGARKRVVALGVMLVLTLVLSVILGRE